MFMADIPKNAGTTAILEGTAETGSFSGQLEVAGDHDWIKVSLTQGITYHFYLSFLETARLTIGDSTMALFDQNNVQQAANDDYGTSRNSSFAFLAPSTGIFYVDVGEYSDDAVGDYSLYVTSFGASEDLLTEESDISEIGFNQHRVVGGKGADRIQLGADPSEALGEQGNDILLGGLFADHLSGGLGNDHLEGRGGFNTLFGDAGNDDLFNGDDDGLLYGGPGDDNLNGGAGKDNLYGGTGKDILTGNGGADIFYFRTLAESPSGAKRDVILDFTPTLDLIDLTLIDAKRGGSDNHFKFIGTAHFHHKAGELHYLKHANFLLLEGDTNGDGRADFQIEVHSAIKLVATDFFL
jgi:hypothetical protein